MGERLSYGKGAKHATKRAVLTVGSKLDRYSELIVITGVKVGNSEGNRFKWVRCVQRPTKNSSRDKDMIRGGGGEEKECLKGIRMCEYYLKEWVREARGNKDSVG